MQIGYETHMIVQWCEEWTIARALWDKQKPTQQQERL